MKTYILTVAAAIAGALASPLLGGSGAADAQGFYHKGHRPASCENHEAWEAYKRDLQVVTGMWNDVDAENLRALAEFDSAADEIDRNMLQGLGRSLLKQGNDISMSDEAAVAKLEHEVSVRVGQGEMDLAERAYEEFDAETAAVQEEAWTELIAFELPEKLLEAWEWNEEKNEAIANLDRSEQSQAKTLRQADDRWRQVLDDLRRATAQDAKCASDRKQLEREAQLEKAARDYIQNLEMGYHRPDGTWQRQWVIRNRAYNDYRSAVDAAKQLLSGARQSSTRMQGPELVFRYADYGDGAAGLRPDSVRLSRADARHLRSLLQRMVHDSHTIAAADTRLVDLYTAHWRSTRRWMRRVTRPR